MTMDSKITKEWVFENAVVIVAHPDDETLWAGGTILMHPETQWTILTLCRMSDPDRSPKFNKAMRNIFMNWPRGNVRFEGQTRLPGW